jgi:hypothetical protein
MQAGYPLNSNLLQFADRFQQMSFQFARTRTR